MVKPTPRGHGMLSDPSARNPGAGKQLSAQVVSYPFLLPPVNPDELGRLGNYRVLRLLGKGGMGLVFHAEDLALCRPVALKVLKPDLDRDLHGWERFLREARLMASIKDASLVTIYQVGQEGDVVYLAMELLEGLSVQDWLERTPRPKLPVLLHVARGIASGLATIHQRGLVHRDIKPANLWLEEPGSRLKILDFGLARFVHDDTALTQSGVVLGTPCFMSPEQARGAPTDRRSDLFSFGCVLYNLCTGTSPFEANTTTAALTALAIHHPQPARQLNPAIPRALSDLVTRLLAKNPEDRPASADEVLKLLRRIELRSTESSGTRPVPPRDQDAKRPPSAPTPALLPRRGKRGSARRQRSAAAAAASRPRRWLRISLAIALAVAVAIAVPWATSSLWHSGAKGAAQGGAERDARTYLADLDPSACVRWPILPPPPPGSPALRALGGASVRGRVSPHGIFMHPPMGWDGPASLTYRLRGECKTFHSEVSQADGVPRTEQPFTFVVYGDGQRLWQSHPLLSQADAQVCDVSVAGVDQLTIEVFSAGDSRGAHAVWVEPYVAR